jgi:P-type Cu+ transporter
MLERCVPPWSMFFSLPPLPALDYPAALPMAHQAQTAPPDTAAARDPVCGMSVDPATAKGGTHDYRGQTYAFCGPRCREKFAADPERYLQPMPSAVATPSARYVCPMDADVRATAPGPCPKCGMALEAVGTGPAGLKTEWVCPMHPAVVRDAPGSCPICGMALEPRAASPDADANPELVDMTRRLWVSVVPTVPVFALSMAEMIPGQPIQHALGTGLVAWIQAILATPVVLWGGAPAISTCSRSSLSAPVSHTPTASSRR